MNKADADETQAEEALISLIIPVYNVEPYLDQCLQSALQQTLRQVEIICVDDCGQDGSAAIVQQYARQDHRLRLIRNSRNLGLSSSRNAGIRHSRAPFIMFLDSDDFYDLNMCEKMLEAIVSSGADIAMCGTEVSYESDSSLRRSDDKYFAIKYTGVHPVSDELVAACDVSAWNKIYRREHLERYELLFPDGLKYEDAYFFHAYMAHATRIAFVREKLYHYRRREGSIMNKTFAGHGSMSSDHLGIAFALHAYYQKWNLLEAKYAVYCRFFLQFVNLALRHCHSLDEKRRILTTACEHVQRHLPPAPSLEPALAERLERFRRGIHTTGIPALLCRESDPLAERICLLGIPLYHISYTPTARKYFLLGLPIRRAKY